MKPNELTNLTPEGTRTEGESLLKALERLKRMASKLLKVFVGPYGSDEMLYEFNGRAIQDGPIWFNIPNREHRTTA